MDTREYFEQYIEDNGDSITPDVISWARKHDWYTGFIVGKNGYQITTNVPFAAQTTISGLLDFAGY